MAAGIAVLVAAGWYLAARLEDSEQQIEVTQKAVENLSESAQQIETMESPSWSNPLLNLIGPLQAVERTAAKLLGKLHHTQVVAGELGLTARCQESGGLLGAEYGAGGGYRLDPRGPVHVRAQNNCRVR